MLRNDFFEYQLYNQGENHGKYKKDNKVRQYKKRRDRDIKKQITQPEIMFKRIKELLAFDAHIKYQYA